MEPAMVKDVPDIFSPEHHQCPYPAYRTLRDSAPVHNVPGTNTWILTRYQDIIEALGRPDVFHHGPAPAQTGSTQNEQGQPVTVYVEDGVTIQAPLNSDPPNHRQYRNLIDKHFSVRGVEPYREVIRKEADQLIDGWISDGRVDFLGRFANPFPVRVINQVFGFEAERSEDLRRWAFAWTMPFHGKLTSEQEQYVIEQLVAFRSYIKQQISRVRETPDDSVTSHLAHATYRPVGEPARPLETPEIVSIIEMLYTGGTTTTEHSLGQMMLLIMSRPGLEDQLREDPDLRLGVVEETLRLESVVAGMFRNTVQDAVIGGVTIPKGSTVHLRFAAANRDDRFFEAPDELQPTRPNLRRHIAFGLGEHHCPGSPLARLEMLIALDAMLDRTRGWRLTPSEHPERIQPGYIVRGLEKLEFEFQTA